MFLVTLMVRENSEDFKGIYGSYSRFESSMPTKQKNNYMERTLKDRQYSITGLFKHIGKGNKLHVPLTHYTANSVCTECTRQNRYAGCDPMNNKFATTKKEKIGYITIIQRF